MSRRARVTAPIVACALFMQNLDSTVIATALPAMARAFHDEPLHLNLAITSYLLSLAVFIPASGWMADRFGTRTVFRVAIVVFTLGSILCGRADNLTYLVAARILQGMGGAMMVPVGRLVLLRTVPKRELVGGDGLAHHAGAARAGAGAAGRRLHRHLCLVALDFLHQRADRRARRRAGHLYRRGRARAAARRGWTASGLCFGGSRSPA